GGGWAGGGGGEGLGGEGWIDGLGPEGRQSGERALAVTRRRLVERGPQSTGEVVAHEPRVELAGQRQRDVRAGGGRGDKHAAVGERLELRDAVVLVGRRGDEHAGTA